MSKVVRPLFRPVLMALWPLLAGGGNALAGEAQCRVPMADWQPREAVQAQVEAQGLVVRHIKIDDGCYEVHALDAEGRETEMRLDPATLAVLGTGPDRDDGKGRRHRK